jgi:DivIVA domain-containing protein
VTNPVQFTVVLRGYDRAEVDATLAEVDYALAGADLAARRAAAGRLRGRTFRVGLRGYDRSEVDAVFAGKLAKLERS